MFFFRATKILNNPELPRLGNGNIAGGTKSQASTASSSATRDSGISMSEAQRTSEEAAYHLREQHHHQTRPKKKQSSSSSSYTRMISVNEMPVNGQAVNLSNRAPPSGSSSSHFNGARPHTNTVEPEVKSMIIDKNVRTNYKQVS